MRGLQERGVVAALSREPGSASTGRRDAAPSAPGSPGRGSVGNRVTALVVGGTVVAGDQVTTSLAEAHVHRPVHLLGPVGLSVGYNSGSAFSLFTGRAAVLAPAAAAIVAILVWLAWRASTTLAAVALGLVLGGALGNLADRALRGHHGSVVDFITLSHWPTFNVADVSITVGTLLLAFVLLRQPGLLTRGPDDGR